MTAFIWDLDGTLIDSYPAIMEALEETYAYFSLGEWQAQRVHELILETSVGALLKEQAERHQIPFETLRQFFDKEQTKRDDKIVLLPHAREILDWASRQGITQYMYTHKGASTSQVLNELGIDAYFTEVLTGVSGFKRKPHPQAILYIMDKYHLNPETTYYIGDRLLDLEVARAAGIKSINLSQKTNAFNQNIKDLSDIKTISL
ncbi:HAD-IA family hydrolase [Streptococcus sp. zg-JUN1979]|uniref:HAD-IA family hydrolase n=1 Tax=Streptococcus sp. zg-JUN1979 TaxID=3391450 RepID=UPI0039A567AE